MKKLFASMAATLFLAGAFSVASADSFKIEEVEVIERDVIELLFTRELDSSLTAVREFILEDTETMVEINVLLSEVNPQNPQKLTLMLESFLEEENDYTITVLDIKDVEGNTIEAGIDSIFTFNTWILSIGDQVAAPDETEEVMYDIDETEEVIYDVEETEEVMYDVDETEEVMYDVEETLFEDEYEGGSIENANDESQDLNMWLENLNAAAEQSGDIGGVTVTSEEMGVSIITQAENNDSLPDTWPEIVLLILIALILTAWIVYVKNYKIS